VASARAWLHAVIQRIWDTTLGGDSVSVAERAELLLGRGECDAPIGRGCPAGVHPGGRIGELSTQPVQRALHDAHAATQHIGMWPQQYEEAGRMLLGLTPFQPLPILSRAWSAAAPARSSASFATRRAASRTFKRRRVLLSCSAPPRSSVPRSSWSRSGPARRVRPLAPHALALRASAIPDRARARRRPDRRRVAHLARFVLASRCRASAHRRP
jgi:hypothetical protein